MTKELKARLSVMFSLFGLFLIMALISPFLYPKLISTLFYSYITQIESFSYYSAWLFDIIGLILGFMGFSSQKKKLAMAGIFLSICGLLGYLLFFFLLWARFGGI
jgi:signal transduction histidine kinase